MVITTIEQCAEHGHFARYQRLDDQHVIVSCMVCGSSLFVATGDECGGLLIPDLEA